MEEVQHPQNVYPEYCFVKEINVDKCDMATSETIAMWMTGLMNASGGLVVLHCTKPHSDKKRDHWLMDFKHHVTSTWIPNRLYRSMVMARCQMIGKQLLLAFFVSKSPTHVTFKNNAYARHAAGIEPITDPEDIRKLMVGRGEAHSKRRPNSQLKRLLKKRAGFRLNEEVPVDYCESSTMEFKHYCTKDKQELASFSASELASRLNRDNEMLKNISAFANTEGGSLVIGIEEVGKRPVVKGFKLSGRQEREESELTSRIKRKLQGCIWNSNQQGGHWSIFYHDVMEGDKVTRKLVEICVHPVPGGMFYKAPKCYTVTEEGQLKELDDFMWDHSLNPVKVEGWQLPPKDRLEKHVTKEEKQPISLEEGASGRTDGQTEDETLFAINETKISKSFKQSQSEYKGNIRTEELSLRDCCIQDMAKHLMTMKPRKAWFPGKRATHMKLSGMWYFRKLRRYINKQKWRGIASVITEQGASNRCNLLVISKYGPPKIICCFPEDGPSGEDKVSYALNLGRKLKAQFLNSSVNASYLPLAFHFDIQILEARQHCPVRVFWDSQDKQPVVYPGTNDKAIYAVTCNGLAEKLLATHGTILNPRGQILTDHLTTEQARILLERKERVLIVRGMAGTGKTVVALNVVQEAKARKNCTAEDVLYICSNPCVEGYIKSQKLCTVWVLQCTDSLSQEQKSLLQTYKLIVVDDIHAIRLHKDWQEHFNDLYRLLFLLAARDKVEISLFFDPYQDFKERLPKNFDEELRKLALSCTQSGSLLSQQVQIHTLDKRIRNSREINRFMQANQNQANVPETFTCWNEVEGDDVTYAYTGNTMDETASSVNAILDRLSDKYKKASIVILCDDDEQLRLLGSQLTRRFDKNLQDGKTFPITDTVLCKLEEFGGLEADVVLFLLPPDWGLDNVGSWKYVYCVSSRAILKLELLLPWNADNIEEPGLQKLQRLLELFKQVRILFCCCKPFNRNTSYL